MLTFKKIGSRKKTLIKASIIIFLFISAFAVFFSVHDIAKSEKMAAIYLTSVTDGVTNTVDAWIEEKKKTLTLISEMPEIKNILTNNSLLSEIRLNLIVKHNQDLDNIFVANSEGEIIKGALYSNNDFKNLKELEIWDNFKKENYKIYLDTYISRSQKTGKLTFIIIKGIFSENNKLRGFIGFTINWDKFIKKFIIPVKVGETGYVAITDTKGRNIGHEDISLTLKDLANYPWMKKLIKEKNGFQNYHFKNTDKLMAFRQSKETGWIINTSIDEDELIEDTIRVRNFILFISIIILILLLFIIGYLDMFKLEAAERNLIESERNFKLLFEKGNDGIFVHDIGRNGESGKFTKANEVFLNFFQCSKEKLYNSTAEDIFNISKNKKYSDINKNIIEQKHLVVETDITIARKNKFIKFRLFLIDNAGKYSVMGFASDITDRITSRRKLKEDRDYLNKKVEERTKEILLTNKQLRNHIKEKDKIAQELSISEDKYRSLIERANDGIMLIGNKKINFANKKIASILKYKEEELCNMPYEKIISEKDSKSIIKNHKNRLEGKITKNVFETQFITSEGKNIDVEINAELNNFTGDPEDFIFIRDITERKKIEKEQKLHNEQLVQTDKLVALGTLVSGVAHEINNPNNAIMLINPIVKEAWESTKPILQNYCKKNGDFLISGMPYSFFKNYFNDIIDDAQECCIKIKNIVDDLKNFAKPDNEISNDEVVINDVIKSSIKLIYSQLIKSTDNLILKLGDNIPPIKGNFRRLEQIIINLIQNACHSLKSKDKKITIFTSYKKGNDFIKIVIIDQGCGISSENIKQIFDPFFTTKRDKGGTGLGLSVSLRLIKEHNGSINFDSKEGFGTKVSLTFPIIKK